MKNLHMYTEECILLMLRLIKREVLWFALIDRYIINRLISTK